MTRPLNPIEIRVLGCLVEKELATPEYYPLSLNALVNACNQKSNRDPVVDYDEPLVTQALENLRPLGLATQSAEGGRVAKFCHNLDGKLRLDPAELAVFAELLLRGPQTTGELRQRASRMHPFASLEEVDEVIEELCRREEPLVVKLPRQPGRKEHRFAQLLGGAPDLDAVEAAAPPAAVLQVRADNERLSTVEQELEELKRQLADLQQAFERFRNQFE